MLSIFGSLLMIWVLLAVTTYVTLLATEVYYGIKDHEYFMWVLKTAEQYDPDKNDKHWYQTVTRWVFGLLYGVITWPETLMHMLKAWQNGSTYLWYWVNRAKNEDTLK